MVYRGPVVFEPRYKIIGGTQPYALLTYQMGLNAIFIMNTFPHIIMVPGEEERSENVKKGLKYFRHPGSLAHQEPGRKESPE